MNYCIIGGKPYDVNVLELEESFNILYTDNTKRTLASGGAMFLDPIGTFIGHKVTFAPLGDRASFDELWDFFKVPRRVGFPVELADNQSTIAYSAYTSNGSRKLAKAVNGVVYWDAFEVNIIPMEAQITP